MVKVSFEFGIVLRKSALAEKSVSRTDILKVFDTTEPLGESEGLLTFGPHFGVEAVQNFTQKLEGLGLKYWDDYFEAVFDHPEWCSFSVDHKVVLPP